MNSFFVPRKEGKESPGTNRFQFLLDSCQRVSFCYTPISHMTDSLTPFLTIPYGDFFRGFMNKDITVFDSLSKE